MTNLHLPRTTTIDLRRDEPVLLFTYHSINRMSYESTAHICYIYIYIIYVSLILVVVTCLWRNTFAKNAGIRDTKPSLMLRYCMRAYVLLLRAVYPWEGSRAHESERSFPLVNGIILHGSSRKSGQLAVSKAYPGHTTRTKTRHP